MKMAGISQTNALASQAQPPPISPHLPGSGARSVAASLMHARFSFAAPLRTVTACTPAPAAFSLCSVLLDAQDRPDRAAAAVLNELLQPHLAGCTTLAYLPCSPPQPPFTGTTSCSRSFSSLGTSRCPSSSRTRPAGPISPRSPRHLLASIAPRTSSASLDHCPIHPISPQVLAADHVHDVDGVLRPRSGGGHGTQPSQA